MPGPISPDLDRWIADLGTDLQRVSAPDPVTPGMAYRSGATMLAFAIEADGSIHDIRIVGSSGDAGLDRRAVAKLRRADPLPAGPDGAERRTQMVVMQVAERIVGTPPRAQPAEIRTFAAA